MHVLHEAMCCSCDKQTFTANFLPRTLKIVNAARDINGANACSTCNNISSDWLKEKNVEDAKTAKKCKKEANARQKRLSSRPTFEKIDFSSKCVVLFYRESFYHSICVLPGPAM